MASLLDYLMVGQNNSRVQEEDLYDKRLKSQNEQRRLATLRNAPGITPTERALLMGTQGGIAPQVARRVSSSAAMGQALEQISGMNIPSEHKNALTYGLINQGASAAAAKHVFPSPTAGKSTDPYYLKEVMTPKGPVWAYIPKDPKSGPPIPTGKKVPPSWYVKDPDVRAGIGYKAGMKGVVGADPEAAAMARESAVAGVPLPSGDAPDESLISSSTASGSFVELPVPPALAKRVPQNLDGTINIKKLKKGDPYKVRDATGNERLLFWTGTQFADERPTE